MAQDVVPELVNVIVALPADTPVTTPEVEPIVATSVLLLVHETPEVLPVNVVVDPTQTLVEPEIPGRALTVTVT